MSIFWNIITVLNGMCILFIVFFERKEDSRRMAWLLALVFLPGIGIVLYFLLSGHFFTHRRQLSRINQHIAKINEPIIKDQLSFFAKEARSTKDHKIQDNLRLVTMNLSQNKSPVTSTDSIKTYTWGQDFFVDLKKDLELATESIYIESFIFHKDEIGCQIMDILCKKARNRCKVAL